MMDNFGEIEIRVSGKVVGQPLTPDSFDIRHLGELLKDVENMLYPTSKKDRPIIAYDVKAGSVKHIFRTSLQAIIGFSAILGQIDRNSSIDFLEYKTAKALENIQRIAIEKDFTFEFRTSISDGKDLIINANSKYFVTKDFWIDTEFYFYGVLKDAGGKTKANIHIDTSEYGYIPIETGEDFLREQKVNLLYKPYGVRAIGKQNMTTGEIDTRSLKLVELIDYDPVFDQDYLDELISKAKPKIQSVDVNDWLHEIRGDYEA